MFVWLLLKKIHGLGLIFLFVWIWEQFLLLSDFYSMITLPVFDLWRWKTGLGSTTTNTIATISFFIDTGSVMTPSISVWVMSVMAASKECWFLTNKILKEIFELTYYWIFFLWKIFWTYMKMTAKVRHYEKFLFFTCYVTRINVHTHVNADCVIFSTLEIELIIFVELMEDWRKNLFKGDKVISENIWWITRWKQNYILHQIEQFFLFFYAFLLISLWF